MFKIHILFSFFFLLLLLSSSSATFNSSQFSSLQLKPVPDGSNTFSNISSGGMARRNATRINVTREVEQEVRGEEEGKKNDAVVTKENRQWQQDSGYKKNEEGNEKEEGLQQLESFFDRPLPLLPKQEQEKKEKREWNEEKYGREYEEEQDEDDEGMKRKNIRSKRGNFRRTSRRVGVAGVGGQHVFNIGAVLSSGAHVEFLQRVKIFSSLSLPNILSSFIPFFEHIHIHTHFVHFDRENGK